MKEQNENVISVLYSWLTLFTQLHILKYYFEITHYIVTYFIYIGQNLSFIQLTK